jgi:hypothetical protein
VERLNVWQQRPVYKDRTMNKLRLLVNSLIEQNQTFGTLALPMSHKNSMAQKRSYLKAVFQQQ